MTCRWAMAGVMAIGAMFCVGCNPIESVYDSIQIGQPMPAGWEQKLSARGAGTVSRPDAHTIEVGDPGHTAVAVLLDERDHVVAKAIRKHEVADLLLVGGESSRTRYEIAIPEGWRSVSSDEPDGNWPRFINSPLPGATVQQMIEHCVDSAGGSRGPGPRDARLYLSLVHTHLESRLGPLGMRDLPPEALAGLGRPGSQWASESIRHFILLGRERETTRLSVTQSHVVQFRHREDQVSTVIDAAAFYGGFFFAGLFCH